MRKRETHNRIKDAKQLILNTLEELIDELVKGNRQDHVHIDDIYDAIEQKKKEIGKLVF